MRNFPTVDSNRESGGKNATWHNAGGTIVDATRDTPAAEGSRYARTWHNQTLFRRAAGRERAACDHPSSSSGRSTGRTA